MVRNIGNVAKIIFRDNLKELIFNNENGKYIVNVTLKEINELQVCRFNKDCNELFKNEIIMNIKSDI